MIQPPAPDPDAAVLLIERPIAGGDVAPLCERLRALAGDGRRIVICDVAALAPDAASIDALARLQLTARRLGCAIALRHASRELSRLLSFCGLAGVVPGGG
ncbi:MAG: hypothetical protein QOE11_450 [Solirubrobacteraceae bacterium]|nr:hypothetical protein [Solirubrobacteraceae bacterium]